MFHFYTYFERFFNIFLLDLLVCKFALVSFYTYFTGNFNNFTNFDHLPDPPPDLPGTLLDHPGTLPRAGVDPISKKILDLF